MKEHLQELFNYLVERKCKDLCVYDLSKEEQESDYIFVATLSSAEANKKLASVMMHDFEIEEFPEGFHKGEWIIFDFNQCVVHLFVGAMREKYNLDKLWQSKRISF